MFEKKNQPLLSYRYFIFRVLRCALLAAACLGVTAFIGAWVYHGVETLSWVESFLNAVLVMTGLGLTVTLKTTAGKIFTTFYAIFSAVVFFAVIGILFAPVLHRLFHHFHLDVDRK